MKSDDSDELKKINKHIDHIDTKVNSLSDELHTFETK